ncbi:MAG: hypothetical protein OEQ16_03010 [Gammaproteobacteria bacterium]|jgi:hypothetical protein|nr:hypothetical protein [Gammaproteobacteria bacterium]MDH3820256.1 hypothetical protein [Gammaproteobacteria bacterium]
MRADRILPWYYAGTILFLLMDYGFGVNIRLAFLESVPTARLAYYGICFACFALMLWRPAWTTLIGTFESLVTLIALIFAMAARVMVPSDAIFEGTGQFVTIQEIINFVISGSVAYLAWMKGLTQLTSRENP